MARSVQDARKELDQEFRQFQEGLMKVASFNVENMFDRAKALNGADWAEGKPVSSSHAGAALSITDLATFSS